MIAPYLGAWQEEEIVRLLLRLGSNDPDVVRKLHGFLLWSLIQSRAALFLLHGEANVLKRKHSEALPVEPQRRYLGIRKADLPGRPVGEVISAGPLWLVQYNSPLVYKSLRFSFSSNGPWRPLMVPTYALPNPYVIPPEPDHTWPQVPVYVQGEIKAHSGNRIFLGLASPAVAPWVDQTEVKKVIVNGHEVSSPWRNWPYLRLYDVTPCLQRGKADLVVQLDGTRHFILDLFAVEVVDPQDRK
jgi:hypothetical protein